MYTHMGNMGVSEHEVYVRHIPNLWQFRLEENDDEPVDLGDPIFGGIKKTSRKAYWSDNLFIGYPLVN